MPLEIANTTLKAAPYFDDFDEQKNYHRILFRPAVAVQARELTQLQTILQNQIERFGNHIFKDGSVVQGCSVEYIPDLEYIGVEDQFSDDSDLSLDDERLIGAIAIGQTSDVQALVVATRSGFIRQNPGCMFVRYTKPGVNGQRTFLPGEELALYAEGMSYVENIVLQVADAAPFAQYISFVVDGTEAGNVANTTARAIVAEVNTTNNTVIVNNVRRRFNDGDVLVVASNNSVNAQILSVSYELSNQVGRINTLTSNTDGIAIADEYLSGFAYGAHVSDGIVYHKGNFIRVNPQSVIVNQTSNDPAGYLLGFETKEEIVTENADDSLNDNALGYSNHNAPGAHRLKLTSTVVSKAANTLTEADVFFPVVEFSNTGVAFERTDPEYAALGDEIAKRTYEESGHYVIKPFLVTSNTDPQNSNTMIYDISPGLAYVKGRRVELMSNLPVRGRRGVDTLSYSEQIVSMNYGNYIEVNEVRGSFYEKGSSVVLYDAAQNSISGNRTIDIAPTGTPIGSANFQDLVHVSGTKGSSDAVYRMYLFNINMLDSNSSFSDAESVVFTDGSVNNYADIVLQSGAAVLQESSFAPLIFDLGAQAVKTLKGENNNADSNYYYTSANTSVSLESAGTINFRVPSGGGILGFSDGSDNSESKVDIILQANALSSNVSTTVSMFANGVMQDTGLGTKFFPGEAVRHGANNHLVTAVLSADQIQVTPAPAALTGQTVQRFHYAGSIVPLNGSSRTLTINANNEATVNLGVTYGNAPISVVVRMYTLQNQGAEIKKEIKRSTVVMIETANTGSDRGPWNLGVPDVLKLRGVYIAQGSGNTATADLTNNYLGDFVLNDGQRDQFYDHASITLRNDIDPAIIAGRKYVVEFDHFVANNTTGKGFFSVDSYPVDDNTNANVAVTINTFEIPNFYSSTRGKTFDLRSVIDFRPYKEATANITSNLRTASVNPGTTVDFNPATTTFKPYPGQNFECNFTHYLPRKDVLIISPTGTFTIVEGVSNINPRAPKQPDEALAFAVVDVPAYPSLTENERAANGYRDQPIKISLQDYKRFTMKDISNIEQRVQRLEYYTSLNALERSAADLKVVGTGGLDRFKNGIFVDALNDHSFGRIDVPQYRVAIDEGNGYARPFFHPEFFELEYDASNSLNTSKIGDAITMGYSEEAFIVQDFATDSRALSGSPPTYTGTLRLDPSYWTDVDTTTSTYQTYGTSQMVSPSLASDYGWWRPEDVTNGTYALTGQVVQQPARASTPNAFLKGREITFYASGLKPYTKFYAYVNDKEYSHNCAPAVVAANGKANRQGNWGTALESNSRGEIVGKLSLAANTLRAGKHTFSLVSQLKDQITKVQVSSASATFEGNIRYQPAPVQVVTPPPVTKPKGVGPTAKFRVEGSMYQTEAGIHTLKFIDMSTPGDAPIVEWIFEPGSGIDLYGQGPWTYGYRLHNSTEVFHVELFVRDSADNWSKYVENITVYKLPPAAPAPVPAPPAPSASINIQSYSGDKPTGSGEAVGAGTSVSKHIATPSTSYPGAFFDWVVDVVGGDPLTSFSITTNSSAAAGGTGYANNQLVLSLTDATPYDTPISSTMTLTCSYKYANGFVIGSTTIPFTHTTVNLIKSAPTIPAPQYPMTGGGCVAVDQLLEDGTRAVDVDVGMNYVTHVPGKGFSKTAVVGTLAPYFREGVRIKTSSGASLKVSALTPFNLITSSFDLVGSKKAKDMLGEFVIVKYGDDIRYEQVVEVEDLGMIEVKPIDFGGRSFAAGETRDALIYSHNVQVSHSTQKH